MFKGILGLQATWPFAKLEIFKEKVVLTVLFKRFEFERHEVDSFEKYKFVVRPGVKINHHKQGTTAYIVFWPFFTKKVLAKAKEAGYEVV